MSAAAKLIGRWTNQGLPIRPGCAARVLDAFEARENARIPADLREFLVLANGIEMDAEGFSFWPLEAYEAVGRAVVRQGAGLPTVADPCSYYVFCDYLHWSWAYAIRMDPPRGASTGNPVIPIGMTEMFVVANSFTEFVDLILDDSPRLYPR